MRKTDPVNHPTHYTSHPSGVECITVTEWYNFNIGNAIKYCWRNGLKGAEDSDIQDLKKAVWYISREISKREKELKNVEDQRKQNESVAQECSTDQSGCRQEASGKEVQDEHAGHKHDHAPLVNQLIQSSRVNDGGGSFQRTGGTNCGSIGGRYFRVNRVSVGRGACILTNPVVTVKFNHGTLINNAPRSGWDLMVAHINQVRGK